MAINLKLTIDLHLKWLRDEEGGERANLRDADLRDADLRGANLSWADLSGADLDFASWPFRCGGFYAKADMRLVAQLAKHLAMLDVSGCCGGIREAHAAFCKTGLAHLFDEFRGDLAITPVEGEDDI